MSAPRKTQGRIALPKAKEEASNLAQLLAIDPEKAVARGGELALAYTLTPRMSIVKELGSRLRSDPKPSPFAIVLRLLATFRAGLKSVQEPEYTAGILDFALSCRGTEATLAEELIYEQITGGSLGAELALQADAVSAALAADNRFAHTVAQAVQLADRRRKASSEVLQHWADLIEPLTRPNRDGKTTIQGDTAYEILKALAAVSADRVPDGVAMMATRLVTNCSVDQATTFYNSGLGRRILDLLRIPAPVVAPPPQTGPVPTKVSGDFQEVRSKFRPRLHQILDEILDEVRDSAAPASVAANPAGNDRDGLAGELENLRTALAQLEQEKTTAREESTYALQEAAKHLEATTSELEASRAETERWRVEAIRRENELSGQFRVEHHQETQRLSRLAVPPLREVYEHIIRLLTSDRRNEPLRRLAISFDSLQKNLGRVFGTTDIQRLPQELLARPEETAADEPGH